MNLQDLDYSYPEELVAQEPQRPSRVMLVKNGQPSEVSIAELLESLAPGDVLVLNDSKVLPRRIFSAESLEILFIREVSPHHWEVLFPASRMKDPQIHLPGDVTAKLAQSGLPQIIEVSKPIDDAYFNQWGELPLPPYIQKARAERHNRTDDSTKYQTAWAEKPGSLASPTASLHFSNEDIQSLKDRGVKVVYVTLHVGLGTFLPIKDLANHQMHSEYVEVPQKTWDVVHAAKSEGQKIWALGTTVVRALESEVQSGFTDLFIQPGYKYKYVDRLLTNFHQPQTTLLALVAAFSDLATVHRCYRWAIDKRFRLFSYGDLSAWVP